MLKLKNVSKYYHSNEVVALGLRKVNLDFELGEFVAVTGESGSGKSTLLNVISGLDTYEDGEMYVNGDETSYFSVADWEAYRRQYIGFVFQSYNIIDSYSVLENVMVALRIQGYDKATRESRALELIKKVGLESHIHHKASKLSGGQKQRAVIARALAKDCPIIVADEPTGNLDSESSATVMSLLQEISKDKLVIVVTHNFDEVSKYATRKIRLFDGEVVEDKQIKPHIPAEAKQSIPSYIMSTGNLLAIAFKNLFTTPRRSIFSMAVFFFIAAIFTLIYGFFVNVTNEAGGSSYNPIFNNVTDNRIIVTTVDETAFSPTDLTALGNINKILGLNKHDVINDSIIQLYTPYEDSDYAWINQSPMFVNPSYTLRDTDLTNGVLPQSKFEIVLEAQAGYEIGDTVNLGYGYINFDPWDTENTLTIQEVIDESSFEFTVVGLTSTLRQYSWQGMAYFHQDFLEEPVVIKNAYIGEDWNSPFRLSMTYADLELFYLSYMEFDIDNTLADNVLNISENSVNQMSWVMEEAIPGLDIEATPDYYKNYTYKFNAFSTFEENTFDVTIGGLIPQEDGKYREVISMNQATYDKLFSGSIYQVTVYAKDTFDAKLIKADIEDLGFNAIYPRNVEDPFTALSRIILSIVFGGLMLFLMIIVYFITFLVMRNIQESKKKDFLILRSIGASKTSLNKITIIELLISTVIGIIIVFGLLYLNTQFKFVKWLVDLLGYFTFGNYVFLFTVLILLSFLLGRRFNSRIFNKSVITSLKAE